MGRLNKQQRALLAKLQSFASEGSPETIALLKEVDKCSSALPVGKAMADFVCKDRSRRTKQAGLQLPPGMIHPFS